MKQIIATLVMSLALISLALAAPSVVFDMSQDGSADMQMTEIIQESLPVSTFNMATAGQTIVISGSMSDESLASEPDMSLMVNLDTKGLKASFSAAGDDIASLVSDAGDFDLDVSASESNSDLRIAASGFMTKSLLEGIIGVDIDSLPNSTEEMRLGLQDFLNGAFADSEYSTNPTFTVDRLDLSGIFIMRFNLSITAENWGGLKALIALSGISQDSSFAGLAECVGMTPESVISSLLKTEYELTLNASGSGDTITAVLDSRVPDQASEAQLKSFDIDITKSGSGMDIRGTAAFLNMRPLLSCLARDALPGDYEIEDFEYSLTGKPDYTALSSFEAQISDFAKKSGDTWQVDIPADMTSDMQVTVNPPTGMAILSVTVGSQSGGSAVSAAGEDFSVTYGKKAGGIDMNLLIGGVIVLLLLFFLLRRRRKA